MTDDRPKVWFEEENERLRELVRQREEKIVDLKKLNAEALTKAVADAAEEARGSVHGQAQRLAEDVVQTLDALQGMPSTFLDAITTAEVCAVSTLRGTPYRCEVQSSAGHTQLWEADHRPSDPKDGDYVAILLLLKKPAR